MIRSSMLEVLKAEFIQVARSQGPAASSRLIFVHAFPECFDPGRDGYGDRFGAC